MPFENLISVAGIATPVLLGLVGYIHSVSKKLTVLGEKLTSMETKFVEINDKIKDVEKDNENTREAVNAIRVSMAKIETYVDLSKDIMSRLDGYLRKSEK